MTENYTDYDMESSIRKASIMLQIDGAVGTEAKSPDELYKDIEEKCPKVAEIMLEQVFEKDKFKNYLESRAPLPRVNGNIISDGDEEFDKFWESLASLYPMLLDAIDECNNS